MSEDFFVCNCEFWINGFYMYFFYSSIIKHNSSLQSHNFFFFSFLADYFILLITFITLSMILGLIIEYLYIPIAYQRTALGSIGKLLNIFLAYIQ